MRDGHDRIFDKVRDIIAGRVGYDRALISPETDLVEDCLISGIDGDFLFEALDEAFEIDWTGLNLRVHFGDEGWFAPGIWNPRGSTWEFQQQPCTVSMIVAAVETGKWPGTPLVPIDGGVRSAVLARRFLMLSLLVFLGGPFALGALIAIVD